ncbi:hypothetical protein C0Q70_00294 [Pomacea canaliculata]|uniref:Uncharacterized protein n=1 Tax=Pomacea canaliculata TaxID=400727 RepID=A0A2T7PW92_POMCA|nr:hypothetical protein C0Q70_00294 [Pomacea canaliculata]
MELQQNTITALTLVLLCACALSALPAEKQREARDLSRLVSLIGRLRDINNQHAAAADDWDDEALAAAASGRDGERLPAGQKPGFSGVSKRQGAWTYDYGLGGGRFGKRYYGDYGIGGGRFGRDVDHVDITDTNDSA